MSGHDTALSTRFQRYAGFVLWYNVAVILFGAWVRISGSGNGCGSSWPLCNGEAIHRPQSVETLIELSHRLTSGLDGIFVLALLIWAFIASERGHRVRRYATLSMVFLISESLVGAGLVAYELVDQNDSWQRALVMILHLVNTFMLVGFVQLTWRAASGRRTIKQAADPWLWASVVALLLVSMMGAVTALGDTVFPSAAPATASISHRMGMDHAAGAHFLMRLRFIHPMTAIACAALIGWAGTVAMHVAELRVYARGMIALVVLQIGVGVVNIALSAPGWMKILHLLVAVCLWMSILATWDESRRVTR